MKNIFRNFRLLTIIIVTIFLYSFFSFKLTYADSKLLTKINSLFPQEVIPSPTLTQEDLVNLTKPSIVRIVQYTKGDLNIHTKIKLDLKNLTITSVPISKPVVMPVDSYLSGSGFVATSDGYIVTNAHVVSNEVFINDYLTKIAQVVVDANIKVLNASEIKAFNDMVNTPDGQNRFNQFVKKVEKEIEKNTTPDLVTHVTVLNPSFIGDSFKSLLDQGFPAKVISANSNFSDDQRDVAVIKIDQVNLPALPFAHSSDSTVFVGQKIYVFGFPGNADLSAQIGTDFIQPSFSSGVISAFKNSTNNDFKVIQTDAKISTGSSGSPILNDKGEVIGIVSMLRDSASTGDSFSFGVPLDVMNAFIGETAVIPEAGSLFKHFMEGLGYLNNKHCNQALSEFALAKDSNKNFFTGTFVDAYSLKCETMQKDGQSIDTQKQELLINLKKSQTMLILSGLGFLVLLIFFILVIGLIRKLKKDEQQISSLSTPQPVAPKSNGEALFVAASSSALDTSLVKNISADSPMQVRLNAAVGYIRDNQAKGVVPGTIVLGLRTSNYSDQEIQQAFMIINKKDF